MGPHSPPPSPLLPSPGSGHIVPLCADPVIPSVPHPSPCPPSSACKLQWLPVATTWVWHSGALKLAPEHLEAIHQPSGPPVTSLLTLPAAGLWIFHSWAWPCCTLALTAGPGSHTPSSGLFSCTSEPGGHFPSWPPPAPTLFIFQTALLTSGWWLLRSADGPGGWARPVLCPGMACPSSDVAVILYCLPDLSVALSMDAPELL